MNQQVSLVQKRKTIGILGGMGPAASANLYNEIIKIAQQYYGAKQDHEFPPMIMYSLPLTDWDTTGFLNLESVKNQLIKGIQTLEKAGVDFIIIGCNTVHHFYNEMQRAVNVPIINMIEETVECARQAGHKKVAVFATESTMKLRVYQNVLERAGIEIVPINSLQQNYITGVIAHAEAGIVNGSDTAILRNLAEEVVDLGAEAIILGCTELPLAIKQTDLPTKLYNSSRIIAYSSLENAFGFVSVERAPVPNSFMVRSFLHLKRLMPSPVMML